MKSLIACASLVLVFALPAVASAQVVVVAQPNHELLLATTDTRFAANNRLVYDFWREGTDPQRRYQQIHHYLV